jgi:hypothetical protein
VEKLHLHSQGIRHLRGLRSKSAGIDCRGVAPQDIMVELEQLLETEYRRHVLGHPNYRNVGYELLIAVWAPPERVALYATSETCIRKVDGFECIGIGHELASFISLHLFAPNARAKSFVVGSVCIGRSEGID